jgi:hypothetical protein
MNRDDWSPVAVLVVRAIDATSRLQPSREEDPGPDGAAGLHEITVTVNR